jgi:tetratricopeptide (TPR) repeat protein
MQHKIAPVSLTLLLLGSCMLSGCTSTYYPPGTKPPTVGHPPGTQELRVPPGPPAPEPGASPVVVNPAIITTPPPRPSPQLPTTSPLDADIRAAMQAGDFERAAALTERALRIRPREAALWYNLASIRLHHGRAQEAEGHAQRALSFSVDVAQRKDIEALLAQIRTQR